MKLFERRRGGASSQSYTPCCRASGTHPSENFAKANSPKDHDSLRQRRGRRLDDAHRHIIQSYDRGNQQPVIRASICTGEKVAGFKDIHTGHFSEIMVIRDEKDLREFLQRYGIAEEEVKKEW